MKRLLLPLPFVLLTFSMVANNVIADGRVILGSFELLSEEYDAPYFADSVSRESSMNGFSAKLYRFQTDGLYGAMGLGYMAGDVEICLESTCSSVDTTFSRYSFEIGWDLGQWIPFVGGSWTTTEPEETRFGFVFGDSERYYGFNPGYVVESTADTFGVQTGVWREFGTFKVRGALNILEESERIGISGGVLFQIDNKFAVGAELEMLLESEASGFRFSLQFGRSF